MNIKKKPWGFGLGDRFEEDQINKWIQKVNIYNKNSTK